MVAVYSTFFSRAFDQANLDVGLHGLPVVMVLDRAGITGDDGPSHHGVLDMALALSIPGMTVFAPSSAPEVEVMLAQALTLDGPSVIRFPKTPAPRVAPGAVGSGLDARRTPDRRRLGVHPGGGKMLDGGGVGRRSSSRPRGSTPRSGTSGWSPTPIPPCWPTPPPPYGDHRRGRRPPGWGGDVPGRCPAHVAAARGRRRRSSTLGIPRHFIAQGKPDRILAQLGLDGPGLARTVRQTARSTSARSTPRDLRAPVTTHDALD